MILARLLQLALDNVSQNSLSPEELRAVNSSGEQLRFLKMYSKCNKSDRANMLQQLDSNLSQCGQGLGALLGLTLPMLVEVIRGAIRKNRQDNATAT